MGRIRSNIAPLSINGFHSRRGIRLFRDVRCQAENRITGWWRTGPGLEERRQLITANYSALSQLKCRLKGYPVVGVLIEGTVVRSAVFWWGIFRGGETGSRRMEDTRVEGGFSAWPISNPERNDRDIFLSWRTNGHRLKRIERKNQIFKRLKRQDW